MLKTLTSGIIHVHPIGKGRARSGNGRMYTPEATRAWEDDVGMRVLSMHNRFFTEKRPFRGALNLSVIFVVQRPKSHFNNRGELKASAPLAHTSKPDLDNMVKAFLDAVQKAGIIADDASVNRTTSSKEWGVHPSIHYFIQGDSDAPEAPAG